MTGSQRSGSGSANNQGLSDLHFSTTIIRSVLGTWPLSTKVSQNIHSASFVPITWPQNEGYPLPHQRGSHLHTLLGTYKFGILQGKTNPRHQKCHTYHYTPHPHIPLHTSSPHTTTHFIPTYHYTPHPHIPLHTSSPHTTTHLIPTYHTLSLE